MLSSEDHQRGEDDVEGSQKHGDRRGRSATKRLTNEAEGRTDVMNRCRDEPESGGVRLT